MAQKYCAWPEGCGNPVKETDEFCWRHREKTSSGDVVPSYLSLPTLSPEVYDLLRGAPASHVRSEASLEYSLFLRESAVADDIAEPVILNAMRISEKYGLEIPVNAERNGETAVREYVAALENTNAKDRFSTQLVAGMTRRLPSGRSQSFPEFQSVIIVVDENGPHPVVVDLLMTNVAPVEDRSAPAFMQRGGEDLGPFGDSPWVGRYQDYFSSPYLSYDQVSKVSI